MADSTVKDSYLSMIVYKTIAGVSGGLGGGAVLLLLYVLSVKVTGDLGSTDAIPGLGSVIVGAVLLLVANMAGSLLSTFFFGLVEKAKYQNRGKALLQIGLLNLMVFVLLIPVYIISNIAVPEYLILIFVLQIIFTIQASNLIFESICNPSGILAGIYSTTIALLVSTIVVALISIVAGSPMIVLMIAFPVTWGAIGLSQSVISIIRA